MSISRIIHLYCTVIDNFGDVGVCWRLARQLAHEYDLTVNLWIDDWKAARQLIGVLPEAEIAHEILGVRVHPWSQAKVDEDCTGDVLIEGFGCTLPKATLAQLKARDPKPLWIDLEYFSAETWVTDFHLRSGYDAEGGTARWMFIPGVQEHSGGLIRERDLLSQREAWQRSDEAPALMQQLGIALRNDQINMLCFAYNQAPYMAWLHALKASGLSTSLWLCGQYTQAAFRPIQQEDYPNLHWHNLPFISQPDFDRVLWSADLLWVRGEDSMARALWSGRPFIWHIYPQADDAHHAKLAAWLDYYTQPFPKPLRDALVEVHLLWNGVVPPTGFVEAWAALMAQWPDWQTYSRQRSNQLAQLTDLAQRLVAFVAASA